MDKRTLVKALKLSHVPRWVIMDMLKPQYVGDHVYRTQVIAVQLIQKLKLEMDEAAVVRSILFHDVEEGETGDVPSSFKLANQELEPSGTSERALLRLADTIEAAIWLHRYGKNPHRVMRFIEAKILFLQKELAVMCKLPASTISEVIDNLIATGRNYD